MYYFFMYKDNKMFLTDMSREPSAVNKTEDTDFLSLPDEILTAETQQKNI